MELRVLEYFLAVAREENISAAANVMNVSQPTLSRQLMDLEKELGKTLFIRGNRKITLTEEGILLRKRASEIIDIINKTKTDISTSTDDIAGDIYIGAGEARCFEFIARAVRELQSDYPGIHFHISSGDYIDVTEQLERGVLDYGLIFHDFDKTRYNSIKLPSVDRWGILMPRDCELARKKYVTPEDLKDKPLLFSRQILNEAADSRTIFFNQKYIKDNAVGTFSLIYNASIMVEEGIGYAFTFDYLVNTEGNEKICFRPFKSAEPVIGHVIWNRYQILSKASQAFLEKLKKAIAYLP